MSIKPSRLIANLAVGAAIALAAVPAAYARHGADDPPSHDVGDDNGGLVVGGHGADDPVTHVRHRHRHETRHHHRHHHRHGRHHG